MARPNITIPSLEERLAYVQSQRGVPKFNRITEAKRLPPGSVVYTDLASADNMRRYADAIGDFNLRFRDSNYAKTTKYGHLIAQPTFLASAAHHCGGHEEVTAERPEGYQTIGARAFNTGAEWEYFRPVHENDKLDFQGVGFIDAKIVKSNFSSELMFSNEMMVTTSICEYRNQLGEIIALVKSFVHHSSSDQASASIGINEIFTKPYIYSAEEIATIVSDKEKEELRGNCPRYWEDIVEGQPIGHIVIGPWTIMNCFAWMSAAGMKGIRFPLSPGEGIYDPRINASTTLGTSC